MCATKDNKETPKWVRQQLPKEMVNLKVLAEWLKVIDWANISALGCTVEDDADHDDPDNTCDCEKCTAIVKFRGDSVALCCGLVEPNNDDPKSYMLLSKTETADHDHGIYCPVWPARRSGTLPKIGEGYIASTFAELYPKLVEWKLLDNPTPWKTNDKKCPECGEMFTNSMNPGKSVCADCESNAAIAAASASPPPRRKFVFPAVAKKEEEAPPSPPYEVAPRKDEAKKAPPTADAVKLCDHCHIRPADVEHGTIIICATCQVRLNRFMDNWKEHTQRKRCLAEAAAAETSAAKRYKRDTEAV